MHRRTLALLALLFTLAVGCQGRESGNSQPSPKEKARAFQRTPYRSFWWSEPKPYPAVSPDGKWLAINAWRQFEANGMIHLMDLGDAKGNFTLPLFDGEPHQQMFADNKYLISGVLRRQGGAPLWEVTVWDITSRQRIATFPMLAETRPAAGGKLGMAPIAIKLAASPNGKLVAAAGDHSLYLLGVPNLERLGEVLRSAPEVRFGGIAFYADSKHLAVSDSAGTLEVYEIAENGKLGPAKLTKKFTGPLGPMAARPDGTLLAVASRKEDKILLLKPDTLGETRRIHGVPDNSFAFSPGGDELAYGSVVCPLDDVEKRCYLQPTGFENQNRRANHSCYFPDGKTLVIGWDQGICFYKRE